MGSLSMQNMSPVGISGFSWQTNFLQQGLSGIPAMAGSEEAHMLLPDFWQSLLASTERETLRRRRMARYIMLQVLSIAPM